ncbi:Sas10/Utp3/C1D family [Zea mays]|uniref:Sas10/Utp3/C1D family n=1 Tax=Zea mays TaxID=4577 RepID=A0A1D6GRA1_MAIZE|nr:Sas10/Utp3/C1D family [Zea mays]
MKTKTYVQTTECQSPFFHFYRGADRMFRTIVLADFCIAQILTNFMIICLLGSANNLPMVDSMLRNACTVRINLGFMQICPLWITCLETPLLLWIIYGF